MNWKKSENVEHFSLKKKKKMTQNDSSVINIDS